MLSSSTLETSSSEARGELLKGILQVHPLVSQERERWLEGLDPEKTPIAVLDIPLLYETGSEKSVRVWSLLYLEARTELKS